METCIGIAFIGGVLMAIAGFVMIFLYAAFPHDEPVDNQRKSSQHFRDAQVIILLSLAPQILLLSLPLIYEEPLIELAPLAVSATATVSVLWGWVLVKFVQAARCARPYITYKSASAMFLPIVAPILFVVAMCCNFGRPRRPMGPVITVTILGAQPGRDIVGGAV